MSPVKINKKAMREISCIVKNANICNYAGYVFDTLNGRFHRGKFVKEGENLAGWKYYLDFNRDRTYEIL